MKTAITYCTTHGCTERIACKIKNSLGGDIQLINLKKDSDPKIGCYDRIIIGGSIHAGQIQKRVKEFCLKNLDELKNKELGLFICCMEEDLEKAQIQLLNAFPKELHHQAKATACLGGEFNFEKMNYLQRMIVKKLAHVENSVSRINEEAIKGFTKKLDRVFNPFLLLI